MLSATLNPSFRVISQDPERELIQAMEDYKRRSGRMFPTWCEVLEVLRALGYEKTDQKTTPDSSCPLSVAP
jgi:hypothetical protein